MCSSCRRFGGKPHACPGAAAAPARAADASPWDTGKHWAVRLIAASADGDRFCGRHRNQLDAGLEDLLALSGRFRRAAGFRLRGVRERQERDRPVAGAAAFPRRAAAMRSATSGMSILPLRIVPQDRGQAGQAAPRARLWRMRKAMRAGRQAKAELAFAGSAGAHDAALAAAEARVPKPATLGRRHVRDPCVPARTCVAAAARHRRHRGARCSRRRSLRRRPDRRMGLAAARADRRAPPGRAPLRLRARWAAARAPRPPAPRSR